MHMFSMDVMLKRAGKWGLTLRYIYKSILYSNENWAKKNCVILEFSSNFIIWYGFCRLPVSLLIFLKLKLRFDNNIDIYFVNVFGKVCIEFIEWLPIARLVVYNRLFLKF